MLNALGRFIPDEDRVLLIEDTAEIQLEKPNLVRFEARQAQNGLPAVTIRDLLKASLRHRPDRIILGEIRGGEAFDFFNSSIPATQGRSQPYTPVPLNKRSQDSRAAFCKAASNCLTARSRRTSATRSTSSFNLNGDRAGVLSRKSLKSTATVLKQITTTCVKFSPLAHSDISLVYPNQRRSYDSSIETHMPRRDSQ